MFCQSMYMSEAQLGAFSLKAKCSELHHTHRKQNANIGISLLGIYGDGREWRSPCCLLPIKLSKCSSGIYMTHQAPAFLGRSFNAELQE